MHNIACKCCKAVCQTTEIQFNPIVRIFHIELSVKFLFAVFILCHRQPCHISNTIDMQSISARRNLCIGTEAFQHHLYEWICQFLMVDIKEEIPLRNHKANAISFHVLLCQYGFIICYPCFLILAVCTCRTASGCNRFFCFLSLNFNIIPAKPDFHLFQLEQNTPLLSS